MPVIFQEASTGVAGSGTGWAAITLPKTAGVDPENTNVKAGDLYIMHLVQRTDVTPEVIAPAGWTKIDTTPTNNTATYLKHYAFYRVADLTEPATLAVSMTPNTGTSDSRVGRIYRFRGNATTGNIIENVTQYGVVESISFGHAPTYVPAGDLGVLLLPFSDNAGGFNGEFTGETGGDWVLGPIHSTSQGLDSAMAIHTAEGQGQYITDGWITGGGSVKEQMSTSFSIKAAGGGTTPPATPAWQRSWGMIIG